MNKNIENILGKVMFKHSASCRVYNKYRFYQHHKRWPKADGNSYNDIVFNVKQNQGNNVLRQFVADKEFVKIFVRSLIGEEYNVPTIKVLYSKKESATFLNQLDGTDCIIKPTHLSGGYEFVSGKITQEQIKIALSWFDRNYSDEKGERVYKNLQPKLIIEPLIDFDGNRTPNDYKIFCRYGKPQMIQVHSGRDTDHRRTLYTTDWKKLPFAIKNEASDDIVKPKRFQEMLLISEKLSEHFDFVRVDLYANDDKIYVGELTNTPGAAADIFIPRKMDFVVGEIFNDSDRDISELL